MSITDPLLGKDSGIPAPDTSDLAESLALLAALGWVQALFTIKQVQQILNTSRASIYRDIAAHRLEAVKNSGATRITAQSLARRLAKLPRAQVRFGMTAQPGGGECTGRPGGGNQAAIERSGGGRFDL